MSPEVFLDTQGLVALLNRSDSQHQEALKRWEELYRESRRLCLTDWILAETGNGLARTAFRQGFARWAAMAQEDSRLTLITIGDALLRQALQLYREWSDKDWGLVDCASFVVMRERGIQDALTQDHHFIQAGFPTLL